MLYISSWMHLFEGKYIGMVFLTVKNLWEDPQYLERELAYFNWSYYAWGLNITNVFFCRHLLFFLLAKHEGPVMGGFTVGQI